MMLIEKIKASLSIEGLLNHLGLKPNQGGYIYSIYKNEETPSLIIYPDSNSYYDFSTAKGGDVIQFYEGYFRVDTKQAVKKLSEMLNLKDTTLTMVQSTKENPKSKQSISVLASEKYYFMERAGVYEYDANLNKDEAEKLALQDLIYMRKDIQINIYESLYSYCKLDYQAYEYLTSIKRKLNDNIIKKFKLFSLKDNTEIFLKDSYSSDELFISGLFNQSGHFIFTNHRLIIPYTDNGQIVYLRGRYFFNGNDKATDGTSKYIGVINFATNLTSKRFFNIDTLKDKTDKRLVITEGEFDCMITEQFGAKAVGIPGVSNFPRDKINILNDYDIYLAFDNDEAELKATKEISKYFTKNISVIKINNGKDLTEIL